MHKIHCEKCGVGLYSDLKLKEWICSPCIKGISPSSIICIACSLSNGVFICADDNRWVHLFCGLILKPYVKSTTNITLSKNALNCTVITKFPKEIFTGFCNICKKANESVLIACSLCKELMHISCVINKSWKIIGESFECGCSDKKKPTKKVKSFDLPPVRGPSSCLILENIMEKIIKADNLMIFRDESQEYTKEQKEDILNSLSSTCYIDSTPGYLAIIINKSKDFPSKKLKLQHPSNILIFSDITDVREENEPKYVNNYKAYESQKIASLDHIYKYYIRGHAYFSVDQILHDFRVMILSKLNSSNNVQEKIYINNFWDVAVENLQQGKSLFEKAIVNDWKAALDTNQNAAKVTSEWHKEPFESRDYEMINDYLEVSEGTKARLNTKIKGKCDGNNCNELSDLGPFELINSTWKSQNSDRAVRVECSDQCLCDKNKCKNRQISLKQFQILDEDVKEIPTWGFDIYRVLGC